MHSTATADDGDDDGDVAIAAAINLGLFSRKGEFGCWRGEERRGREYVRAAEANELVPLPLSRHATATHATETFKSFWRQKSVADLCGSRILTADAVDNLIPYPPFIQKEPSSLASASLSLSPPPSPPLSFPDVCLTKFEPPHNQRGGGSRA